MASEGDQHVHVLLKKLAAEVNLMHDRLDAFEANRGNNAPTLAIDNGGLVEGVSPQRRSASQRTASHRSKASAAEAKVKSDPSSRWDSSPVKEEMEHVEGNGNSGPIPAASLPSTARSNSKSKSSERLAPASNLSQTFLKRKAGDRRKELSQLSAQDDTLAASGMISSRALSRQSPSLYLPHIFRSMEAILCVPFPCAYARPRCMTFPLICRSNCREGPSTGGVHWPGMELFPKQLF